MTNVSPRGGGFVRHDTNLALMRAAVAGDDAAVVAEVAAGADAKAADAKGCTPLMYAAEHGNHAMVRCLIAAGASVNAQANSTRTVLMCAAHLGHVKVVRELLSEGASIDVQGSEGFSALLIAIRYKRTEVAQVLMAAGANVNLSDKQGITPLMHAVNRGDSIVVLDLLTRKADVGARDINGHSAFDYSKKANMINLLKRGHVQAKAEQFHAMVMVAHSAYLCSDEKEISSVALHLKKWIEAEVDVKIRSTFYQVVAARFDQRMQAVMLCCIAAFLPSLSPLQRLFAKDPLEVLGSEVKNIKNHKERLFKCQFSSDDSEHGEPQWVDAENSAWHNLSWQYSPAGL